MVRVIVIGGNSFYCPLGNDVTLSPTPGQMRAIPQWAVLVMLVLVVIVMMGRRDDIMIVVRGAGAIIVLVLMGAMLMLVLMGAIFVLVFLFVSMTIHSNFVLCQLAKPCSLRFFDRKYLTNHKSLCHKIQYSTSNLCK